MRMLTASLDQLLPGDHPVRTVQAFVARLDLSAFEADVKAVVGAAGRPPVPPDLLVALWLWATIEGVASAREIARRCETDLPWQWLCGEVTVNHHLLSDFQTQHVAGLEQLLIQVVATLLEQDLVSLNRVAQDGMRVRASAGSGSFRRRGKLEACLAEARAQVEALQQEAAADQGEVHRRSLAARERAATERAARLEAALAQLPELAEKLEKRKKGTGGEARASMTDPEARRMKMADGGTRPAYNVELATTDETRLIVGVEVTNQGTDSGQMTPMADRIERQYGQRPQEYLVDGGFAARDDITSMEQSGTMIFAPIREEEKKRAAGRDPFARRERDTDEVANWRQRMGTAAAQAIYKLRSSIAEFPNAVFRNRGLRQFLVRGLNKVKAVALWQALAHNLTRIVSQGWLAQL
jgi:transposase